MPADPAVMLDELEVAWRELNADGLIIGTVQKADTGIRVQVRLFRVSSRESAPIQ